ncbi:MAG: outer membrane beta-barrel protein [Tunicatimonas sp.]
MKKTSLLLASLTIVALSFSTQRSVAQDWRFGIKGGLNISNISSDVVNFDSRAAVHLGIFGNTPINSDENLFVQPELLLSLQGAEEGNLTGCRTKIQSRSYLEV